MKTNLKICAGLILSLLSISFLHGQTGDTNKQQSQALANRFEDGAQTAANQERKRRALESIENAVAVLIPGGIVEGSPRQKKFAAIIESFARGQARDAMGSLEKMVEEDPNLPPADIIMAGLTFAIGDNTSGVAILESCAVKYPDYPGVYLSFAQIALNTNRIADASLHADKTARLIEAGNLSEDRRNHFLKQYYEIATGIYLRRKQNREAADTLEKLQALSPNLPFYFYNKAELAFRDGKGEQALNFLAENAKATQSKVLPELTLVDWNQKAGKTEEALQWLNRTLEKHPDDALAQMTAARIFMTREEFPKALMALKRFEEITGNETNQSLDMKGRITFAGLSYEIAAEHFRSLATRTPNDASSANILALCLVESEDPEKRKQALQISQRVASRMSGNPLALASLGYIFLKNGEKEKAAQLMQRVAQTRQGSPEISYLFAHWLIDSGQKEAAAKVLQQAIDSKGLFLYRSASRKLLASIQKQPK